jgi:hypothetical protein
MDPPVDKPCHSCDDEKISIELFQTENHAINAEPGVNIDQSR